MAVRNKRKCRNCPEEAVQVTPEIKTPTVQISSESEGKRLWKNVLFGAGTLVSMIEGYQNLGMPGEPIEAIKGLASRLETVLKKSEATKIAARDEVRSDPQQLSLDEGDYLSGRKRQEPAQEERPSDQPLSAEVGDERVSE